MNDDLEKKLEGQKRSFKAGEKVLVLINGLELLGQLYGHWFRMEEDWPNKNNRPTTWIKNRPNADYRVVCVYPHWILKKDEYDALSELERLLYF